MYLFKTPKIIKALFSSLQWDNVEDKVLLTFDDGPTPELTTYILHELKKHNVKAVFFCVGENVKKYPTLYQQILNDGHLVGNHTMNHLNAWKTKDDEYLKNTKEASRYIKSNLFRPPYGKLSKRKIKLLQSKNYKIMMWSVLTGDFDAKLTKEKCLRNTLRSLKKNSIVVLHDNVKSTNNMKFVLEYLLENKKQLNIKF
jgi:peptidoglycan/xylan/chitin deacetylase (PgdA/CDA1 family)